MHHFLAHISKVLCFRERAAMLLTTLRRMRPTKSASLTSVMVADAMAAKADEYVRGMVTGGTLFEELGFFYLGPIDGHNLDHLLPISYF